MKAGLIDWSVEHAALPGETESGDLSLVQTFDGGALVAVVDGLGHGQEAALAARLAAESLDGHEQDSVISLVRRCHDRLLGTRGVAMSLASFRADDGTLTWLGIGNVEGVVVRGNVNGSDRHLSLLLRSGVVGSRLPPLLATTVALTPGDMVVVATDGIRATFSETVQAQDKPDELARRIMASYRTGTDDALVVVARYAGTAS